MNNVQKALKFLEEETVFDTSDATVTKDDNPSIILVSNLKRSDGEAASVLVYLSDDGCHDFEAVRDNDVQVS